MLEVYDENTTNFAILLLVPRTGLEPVRIAPSDFKSLVSTDSTIPAGRPVLQPGPDEYTKKACCTPKKKPPGFPGGLFLLGGGGENRTLVQVPIQRTSTCVARTLVVGNRLAHGQASCSLLCCIFAVG